MSTSRSASTPPSRPSLAPGAHGRLYIFAVIALALFFGCVVIWRQPPRSYTSRVVLQQTGRHGRLDEKPEIVAEIVGIHCDHAEDGHCADGHAHDDSHSGTNQVPSLGTNAEHKAPHLLVDVQDSDGKKMITIWCASAQPKAAQDEAGLLAQRYVKRVANPIANNDDRAIQQAKAASASARQALRSAEAVMNAFLAEHEDQFSAGFGEESELPVERSIVDTGIAGDQPSLARAAETTPPQSNPVWVELEERLQALRAARLELLQIKTEAHPEVRDLQWQVENLEEKIALVFPSLTPQRANDDEPPQTVAAPEVIGAEPADSTTKAPSPAVLSKLDELRNAVAVARRTWQQAQAEKRRVATTARPPSTAVATIVEPSTIVSRRGGGASRSAVFGGGLLAMFAGLLLAWRSQRLRQPSAVISTLQIESLGAPVVAAIPTCDGPEIPVPQISNPRPIAWITFTCELLVAAIAVTFLLLALADWQTAAQIMNDPLSTFGETVRRLW